MILTFALCYTLALSSFCAQEPVVSDCNGNSSAGLSGSGPPCCAVSAPLMVVIARHGAHFVAPSGAFLHGASTWWRKRGPWVQTALNHTHCACLFCIVICAKPELRPPPVAPSKGAIFESRKWLSLWRNPTVLITKNKPAVCFWEGFRGLTSHVKPSGPQHRGESVRELNTEKTRITQCLSERPTFSCNCWSRKKKSYSC